MSYGRLGTAITPKNNTGIQIPLGNTPSSFLLAARVRNSKKYTIQNESQKITYSIFTSSRSKKFYY
jgi:hypothetical protein